MHLRAENFGTISRQPALFNPTDTLWRVNREWLTALSGARAVLLELAHPAIAAAVAQHSDFQGDPLGRLHRTMKMMTALTFGDGNEVRAAARHIHKCHAQVRGQIQATEGACSYNANDPRLKLWVLATLTDSLPRVYNLLVAPLTLRELENYHAESLILARAFDIPRELTPASYGEFCAYMKAMLNGEALRVGADARAIANALFHRPIFGGMTRAASLVSIGLRPPRLREQYGFAWGETRERRLQRFAAFVRKVRALLPDTLCVHPAALRAERHWHESAKGFRNA